MTREISDNLWRLHHEVRRDLGKAYEEYGKLMQEKVVSSQATQLERDIETLKNLKNVLGSAARAATKNSYSR